MESIKNVDLFVASESNLTELSDKALLVTPRRN